MDGERKKAILTWLNCLQVGDEISELSQLMDGFHVISILKIIWTSNEKRNCLSHYDWITSLRTFLEDFYRTRVTDVVDFERIAKGDEFEIAKATVLLLSATVHFETDRRFLDLPTCLDAKVQHQIKQIIEGVLLDGEQPLNRNFADILVSTDLFDCLVFETTSPRKSGDDSNRSFGESGDSKTVSPIRQLLQSPLIVNKLKLRDKDRHIHRLESELDVERIMRADIESELQKTELLIEKREKALKSVEKELMMFQTQYEDTKSLFDEATVELERLRPKSEKCESMIEECKLLRSELDAVIDDKLALQEENDKLYEACQFNTERLSELERIEQKLCEVQTRLEDRESVIEALTLERQVFFKELYQMRQIYREKTMILEDTKQKPDTNGEIMTVVTDKCLRELKVLHQQLKDQYDCFKRSSESNISKLATEKTSLEAVIDEKARKIIYLQEKRARLQDELNKQNSQVSELAVKISKLEEDIDGMLTNKLELEKEVEAKERTVAELKTEGESRTLEFRNSEEQMLKELNATKSELAIYVEKCEMLEAEIGRLDDELHTLRNEMADERLKWDLQVELMTTEKETLKKELKAQSEDAKRLVVELSVQGDLVTKLEDRIKTEKIAFERMVAEHEAAVEWLETRLSDLKKQLSDKEAELRRLENVRTEEKSLLEARLNEFTSNVVNLQEVILLKDGLVERLEQEISHEKSSSEKLIDDHKSEIQRLSQEVEENCRRLKEKEEQLQTAKAQLKESTDNISKLREVVSQKDGIIESLEREISHEKCSAEQVIDEHKSEIQRLRADIEEIGCRLMEKEEQLRMAVKAMEDERVSMDAELRSRENGLKTSQTEMVQLRQHICELKEKMVDEEKYFLQTVEFEQSTALKLREQLDGLESVVREKEELLDAACKKSEQDRSLLDATVKTRDEEIERLQADVDQKNALVSEVRRQLNEEREKYEELETNAKISIEKLEKELEETLRDLEKFRSEVTDKDEAIKNLEKAVTSLEETLKKLELEKISLESHCNALKEDISKLEFVIEEKDALMNDVQARTTEESNGLKGTLLERQSAIDGLQEQVIELRTRVQEKEQLEAIYSKNKASFECFKVGEAEKDRKIAEERDNLTRRMESFQLIIDDQQDMIKRLEGSKMKSDNGFHAEQNDEAIELSLLKVPNFLDVEKVRRRSSEVESRLCYSDLRDVSLCRSMTVNGTFMDSKRFDFDIHEHNEDAMNNQLEYSQEFGIEDSLEEDKPQFRLSNESPIASSEYSSETSLLTNLKLHCDNLRKENETLFEEKNSLESHVKDLQGRLDHQKAAVKLQTDLPMIIQQLKKQVLESENKNTTALRTVKVEYDSMKKQYEAARKAAQELKNVVIEKEILLGEQTKQLEQYKEYCDSKKHQLSEVVAMFKNEKEMSHYLKVKLHEEEKKCAPYMDKIREQEMSLQRYIQEKRSLETQLSLASQKLRNMQKGSLEFVKEEYSHRNTQAPIRASTQSMLPRHTSSSLNALTNFTVPMRESVSDGQLAFEDLAREMSESTHDLDSKVWTTANVSAQRAVPAGAGNYFTCEDEEGEFLNFSYLNDLKRGKCNVDNQHGRISELQRRNTLCLPHLKTSYPVEMQTQSMQKFTDDDMKAGAAVEDSLLSVRNETMDANMAARKSKPIQPSYQKPGPPTPGKSGKQGSSLAPEKPIKTPSSLKKLRSYFGTPKRGNRENMPPEKSKVSRVRKNIAFQVGFSPKVKSVSKQQPLNNRVDQRKQPN